MKAFWCITLILSTQHRDIWYQPRDVAKASRQRDVLSANTRRTHNTSWKPTRRQPPTGYRPMLRHCRPCHLSGRLSKTPTYPKTEHILLNSAIGNHLVRLPGRALGHSHLMTPKIFGLRGLAIAERYTSPAIATHPEYSECSAFICALGSDS